MSAMARPMHRTATSASSPAATRNRDPVRSCYRTEILPLWAPCAPAVSPRGGGVPGMNGAFGAHAGGRARRRVVPCPTAEAGIGGGVGACSGVAGAAEV